MSSKRFCDNCKNEISKMVRKEQRFCAPRCRAAYWNKLTLRIPAGLKPEQRDEVVSMIENFAAENQREKSAVTFRPSV
jgi:hypothetical protein